MNPYKQFYKAVRKRVHDADMNDVRLTTRYRMYYGHNIANDEHVQYTIGIIHESGGHYIYFRGREIPIRGIWQRHLFRNEWRRRTKLQNRAHEEQRKQLVADAMMD